MNPTTRNRQKPEPRSESLLQTPMKLERDHTGVPSLQPLVEQPGKVQVEDLDLHYGSSRALQAISLTVYENTIAAFIGPSGCGKSTLLRCLNRMNDTIPSVRVTGRVLLEEVDIYDRRVDVVALRKRVGMVFQKPNPFPMSIFDNVASGPRIHGVRRIDLPDLVERSLRSAALWEEVKDKLKQSALELSGGQQQRLCIARALAVQPEVLLLDEPCSALDPISTGQIEELMIFLKERYTLVLVTHNMFQASRVSDNTAFMLMGELIEWGTSEAIFTMPKDRRTEGYITGRFG